MIFATAWENRPEVPGLTCPPPEKTPVQQHFKDECDIHHILRRIEQGGDPAVLEARKGLYADLTGLPVDSLADAYDAVATAEDAFDSLPAALRERFDNDPVTFIEYIDANGVDSVAEFFGEKAVPTEPKPNGATTINDDASKGEGETA